jgi:hypothetical protein
VSYVDAGYAAALATLFVYAISLVLRRRRWERALRMSEPPTPPPAPAQAPAPASTTPSAEQERAAALGERS